MTTENQPFRNILCIRADNMGDVIMSSPAMRALKESFGCRITLLTSRAGRPIAPHIDCVDAVISADLPWVKTMGKERTDLNALASEIAWLGFDAAVIFTVYSQSALPAAMLAYMAGIPVRMAYARENPYDLLTHWLPDNEPYERILHQVERDLALVKALGAKVTDDRLRLVQPPETQAVLDSRLAKWGIGADDGYIVLHPGVSEEKRQYPVEKWIETGKLLAGRHRLPLLVSGSMAEKEQADAIARAIGRNAISVAGMFPLGEFISLIGRATCVVSVNTGTIHIAAALQTPMVVLYAQTNPQHAPWKSPHELLHFSVPAHLQSRNSIIRDVAKRLYADHIPYPGPHAVEAAVQRILTAKAPGPVVAWQARW